MRYDHYREARLEVPWRVPVLHGKLPSCPQADSTAEQRGKYALFLMLLFRPWRDKGTALQSWLQDHLPVLRGTDAHTSDAVWLAIYAEYMRWRRDDLSLRAQPFFRRDGIARAEPTYDTEEWWACAIYSRLNNMELFLSRKRSQKMSVSTDIDLSLIHI